MYIQR